MNKTDPTGLQEIPDYMRIVRMTESGMSDGEIAAQLGKEWAYGVAAGLGIVGAAAAPEIAVALSARAPATTSAVTTVANAVVENPLVSGGAAAAMARGVANEKLVLRKLGMTPNTQAVATPEGRAIPDALTSTVLIEIKDAAKVSLTKQLRIETGAARASGRESVLVTGTCTYCTRPTEEAFDRIIRLDEIRPSQ